MNTYPDCTEVKRQVVEDNCYEAIDIGNHVRWLQEFLQIRNTQPEFADACKKAM